MNRTGRVAARTALAVVIGLAASSLVGCGRKPDAGGASRLERIKQDKVLRAGIRFDNPPHSFIDGDGKWIGFDVDIAQGIADDMGVRLQKEKVDELTRISYLQDRKIDVAVASMSKTVKRGGQIDFSQTYFFSGQTILVKADGPQSLEDLAGTSVGVSRGSSSLGNWKAWLKAHGHPEEPQITEFGDKRAAVDAVRAGSVVGWAEDYEVLARYSKGIDGLRVLDKETIGVKLDGIGVAKNDSVLLDGVNLALQHLAASGEYDRIYNRWFGPASDTPVPRQGRIEVWPGG